jgi:hypothetical protein
MREVMRRGRENESSYDTVEDIIRNYTSDNDPLPIQSLDQKDCMSPIAAQPFSFDEFSNNQNCSSSMQLLN